MLFAIAGFSLLVVGLAVVGVGVREARTTNGTVSYLQRLAGGDETDEFQQRLAQPFVRRVVAPLGPRVVARVAHLTPSSYLDRLHLSLLHAGLSSSVTAEEFATAQVVLAGLALVVAFLLALSGGTLGLLLLVIAPTVGAIAPSAWLKRIARERGEAVLRDLPDVLDLLAISVEAGTSLEQAMAIAGSHFTSPLADELLLTLREMELGLPRRQAFQNLRRRTNVPELSNVVLVLTQADTLGTPISRVLHTQSHDMRDRRRQWARERAGKMPVKILFPMVVFIFPAIFAVLLSPAVLTIMRGLK
jgi:tight adherence protein C